jgi:bacillithiol biosynthesis cysteine-adding enzyme BshC
VRPQRSLRPAVAVPIAASGFAAAWQRAEPEALSFLPRHPVRPQALADRLEEVVAQAPAVEVWARAEADAERLGADAATRDAIRSLARGEALCVTTGQQPGLLLGPLYTVYKLWTALVLARRLADRLGRPVVPVFWNAADDSDLEEVRTAVLPEEDFRLARYSLSGSGLPAAGMVGDVPCEETAEVVGELESAWRRGSAGCSLLARLQAALARARDHGELASALLYSLTPGTGLVIVDGRWPELRRAAVPLLRRYVEKRNDVAGAVVQAGRKLEGAGFRVPIHESSARAALFDIRQGRREAFRGDEEELRARVDTAPETLSPNVILRSPVQDTVLPNLATVAGPGEIAYHAQLAAAYAVLGIGMPLLVPRFAATLVPPGVWELASRRGIEAADLVEDFDGALRASAERAVPEGLRASARALDEDLERRFEELREESVRFESNLGEAVTKARERAREVLRKMSKEIATAARTAEVRRDPAVKHYREFLRPRGLPQERVLSSVALWLGGRADPLSFLNGPLGEHLEAAEAGRPVHWLLDWEPLPPTE